MGLGYSKFIMYLVISRLQKLALIDFNVCGDVLGVDIMRCLPTACFHESIFYFNGRNTRLFECSGAEISSEISFMGNFLAAIKVFNFVYYLL